jgi:hypothetical protein
MKMVNGDHGIDQTNSSPAQNAPFSQTKNTVTTNVLEPTNPPKTLISNEPYLWFKLWKLNKFHSEEPINKSEHLVISSAFCTFPQFQGDPLITNCEIAEIQDESDDSLETKVSLNLVYLI